MPVVDREVLVIGVDARVPEAHLDACAGQPEVGGGDSRQVDHLGFVDHGGPGDPGPSAEVMVFFASEIPYNRRCSSLGSGISQRMRGCRWTSLASLPDF
jgi:hypothetical protein